MNGNDALGIYTRQGTDTIISHKIFYYNLCFAYSKVELKSNGLVKEIVLNMYSSDNNFCIINATYIQNCGYAVTYKIYNFGNTIYVPTFRGISSYLSAELKKYIGEGSLITESLIYHITVCFLMVAPTKPQQEYAEMAYIIDNSYVSPSPDFRIYRMMFGGESIGYDYFLLMRLMQSIAGHQGGAFSQGSGYFEISEKGYKFLDKLNPLRSIRDHTGNENVDNIEIKRNSTSVVTNFVLNPEILNPFTVLLPGDATVHVFGALSSYMMVMNHVSIMLAPHHGSDHTNISYIKDDTLGIVPDKDQPIEELLNIIKGYDMVVSAYNARNAHPGTKFMDKALLYANANAKSHLVNYCNDGFVYDPITNQYVYNTQIKDTTKSVYTTQCLMFGHICYHFPNPSTACEKIPEEREITDIPPEDCFI